MRLNNSPVFMRVVFVLLTVSLYASLLACSSAHTIPAATEVKAATVSVSDANHQEREKLVEQWVRARAAYERSLDYSALSKERQDRYKTLRALVEARYFLNLAEKDLVFLSDKTVAVKDFDQAKRLLEKAKETVSKRYRRLLNTIYEQLLGMQKSLMRDINDEIRWVPVNQRGQFDLILMRLEKIIRGQWP